MINGYKVVVVLPAYNAAMTLEKSYSEIPRIKKSEGLDSQALHLNYLEKRNQI